MSSVHQQISKQESSVPKIAIILLGAIAVFGVFIIGFDSGQLESLAAGPSGMHPSNDQLMWLHEFSHDVRHAAGFFCH